MKDYLLVWRFFPKMGLGAVFVLELLVLALLPGFSEALGTLLQRNLKPVYWDCIATTNRADCGKRLQRRHLHAQLFNSRPPRPYFIPVGEE